MAGGEQNVSKALGKSVGSCKSEDYCIAVNLWLGSIVAILAKNFTLGTQLPIFAQPAKRPRGRLRLLK